MTGETGCFHIPGFLVTKPGTGHDLIIWCAGRTPSRVSLGQVALAEWFMAAPMARSHALDHLPVDVGQILAGHVEPSSELAGLIQAATRSAVEWDLWDISRSCDGADTPQRVGDGARDLPPAAVPSPNEPADALAICHGRLGERSHGPLWKAVRGIDGRTILTSCFGFSIALDDMSRDALEAECAKVRKIREGGGQ